jgi:adenylate cyclase
MTQTQSNFEFQVGGSLESNAPSYVTRQADSAFYEGLKVGEFCYVLNSRQMGKSSLRVRAMQRLQTEGTVCVFIDLTGMGKQDVTPEKWYGGIVQSLVSSCQLSPKVQWRTWWRERRDLLAPVQRLGLFVEEVLLVEIRQNIVVFIDEIDRVLSQNFSLDEFFALIRFFSQQREVHADYKRLTFALLGVAAPSDLIRDKTQTPFNIGKAIALQGFQLHEVQPLVDGLVGKVDHPQAVMREILDWTGGQPFLTQKICRLIVSESTSDPFISVERVVRSRLLENWESQDEPEHLRTIRDRICYRNERRAGRLLGLHQKILQQGEIGIDNSSEQVELRLSGLVVERQGKLHVYNRIYATVFDCNWVEQKLAHLRPYAEAISLWQTSGCHDESKLLQGEALQEALSWSLDKSLSDLDYQFLGASQDLARRQAQTELASLEQASQLLITTRQKAKQEILKRRIGWTWIPKVALGVTIPVLLLRFSGLLQGLEWNLLDQFFRWRPLESPEKRIAVVTIDESDIGKITQWPIPDRVMARAITNINAQNPRAIGLDIYRDLAVEPGHADLVHLFQTTPHLFGIEKLVGHQIPPPPTLNRLGQVGFSDQVLDADGKVRRGLLSVLLSRNEVRYSLAVRLALHYLEGKGIHMVATDNPNEVRLGKAVFERFNGNEGGYVRANSGGYQILLNFRGTQKDFPTFSLTEILNNQIPANSLGDRLVLIGTTAPSINDLFYTPYSSGLFSAPQPMAGVIVHANIISAMLGAALDGRPLLRVWAAPIEWLWILTWAGIGASISWLLSSPKIGAVGIFFIGGACLGVCYIAFLLGWWLPIIPSLLVLLGTAVILPIVTYKQLEKLQFHRTLALLLDTCSINPTTGRIAIEYLKQSESPENQTFIEQQLYQEKK